MGYLAFALVVLAATGLGIGWRRLGGVRRALVGDLALAECVLAGLLGLFLWSTGLGILRLPWTRLSWALPIAVGLAILVSEIPRRLTLPRGLEWGDGLALAAGLAFAGATHLLWNTNPDFIYHWGIKAQKYQLAGGVDLEFLQLPWNGHVHADYPNFLPVLMALPAVVVGSFEVAPALAFSTLFFALAVVAARALSRSLKLGRWARNVAVAVVALQGAMFGIGYLSAGGADWLLTLAVLLAAAVLSRPLSGSADRLLAVAAAFAAASKIEGVALAAAMIAIQALRHYRQRGRHPLSTLGVLGWPAALMVVPWVLQVLRHDLFQRANVGGFAWSKAAVVLAELGHSLLTLNWHYLSLVLLTLPLLAVDRRLRPMVALVAFQLGFYVFVYMAGSHDPRQWIRTSAARLYFHLVPTVWVAWVAFIDHWGDRVTWLRIRPGRGNWR